MRREDLPAAMQEAGVLGCSREAPKVEDASMVFANQPTVYTTFPLISASQPLKIGGTTRASGGSGGAACEMTGETKVGFPAVLKPISGAASLGVKKVTSEAELRSSYTEARSWGVQR